MSDLRILHISDLHFGSSVDFNQNQVQTSLLSFVRSDGQGFDALVVTGDVAYSGRTAEYVLARNFLADLVEAARVPASHIAICPGNHDVDRMAVDSLTRTLESTEQSDRYFSSRDECVHIAHGQKAYSKFYEDVTKRPFYRSDTLSGPICFNSERETVEIWELNTPIFSRDDHDHGKLWVGRASFEKVPAIEILRNGAKARILIGHHPLEWLASEEEERIRALIESKFTIYVRGHLHSGGYAATSSASGDLIQIAAGALYQGYDRPIEANIIEFSNDNLRVSPIRYIDTPLPAWIPDNSKFGPLGATEMDFSLRAPDLITTMSPTVGVKGGARFSHPQLFESSEGEPIFVEPRICDAPISSITPESQVAKEVVLADLLSAHGNVQIECDTEHGGSVLAGFAAFTFESGLGICAAVSTADDMPNYSPKLEKHFHAAIDQAATALVLDGFRIGDHKKMLDAIIASKRFSKIVVISSASEITSLREVGEERQLFSTSPYYVWPLNRPRLRKLAIQIFQPKKEEDVHFAVEKTYLDLVSLAIPLTPANVIMYLHILKKEEDFVPLDRVAIIQKYISDALTQSSDQTASGFGVRDRISLISAFIFDLFMRGRTSFTRYDWKEYSNNYQDRTFSDFSIDGVLEQLLRSRIIVANKLQFFIRYAFVYDFFVGLNAASSNDKLAAFLQDGHHRRLPQVVEVMAAIALDPTPLIETLKSDLTRHLDEFQIKYVHENYDPLIGAEWKIDNADAELNYWDAIEGQIEEGMASSMAIDKVKESILAESRSSDQEVIIQDYAALEIDLFRSANALETALRVAVNLDGNLKLSCIRSILSTNLIVLQIGAQFSKQLAMSQVFEWGGIIFLNNSYRVDRDANEFGELVPWVITSLDLNIAEVICDKIGTRRLGPTFKGVLRKGEDLTEFEIYNLFALILRTKPRDWSADLQGVIERISYRKWRQKGFVDLLMNDFKHEPNTSEDRAKLMHLIAFVETKRSLNAAKPGAKTVGRMKRHLTDIGKFDLEK